MVTSLLNGPLMIVDKVFIGIKISLSKDADPTIPKTSHPLYITVDASLISLGSILFQPNSNDKMQVISYNYSILSIREQTLSTFDRDPCAITFALTP